MKTPEKVRARLAARAAIQSGKLKIGPCAVCGVGPERITYRQQNEAHHHRGYSREHWLDVEWLCVRHHRQRHGAREKPQKKRAGFAKIPEIVRPEFAESLTLKEAVGVVAAANGIRLCELAQEIGVTKQAISRLGTDADRPGARRRIAEGVGVVECG